MAAGEKLRDIWFVRLHDNQSDTLNAPYIVGPFPDRDLAELWSLDIDDRYWTCGKPERLVIPGCNDRPFIRITMAAMEIEVDNG